MLAVMLSRMKDCVPFGRTGYPFVFAIKVDEGRKRCRIASAFHLERNPDLAGKGGVRSSATSSSAECENGVDWRLTQTQTRTVIAD
jgi:hypothetical protein